MRPVEPRVARLEALLQRVRARAAERRPAAPAPPQVEQSASPAPAMAVVQSPSTFESEPPTHVDADRQVLPSEPTERGAGDAPAESEILGWDVPVRQSSVLSVLPGLPEQQEAVPAPSAEPAASFDVPVEMTTWTPQPPDLEIYVEIEPTPVPLVLESVAPAEGGPASESAERLVAATVAERAPTPDEEPGARVTMPSSLGFLPSAAPVEPFALANSTREFVPPLGALEATERAFDHPDPGLEPALEAAAGLDEPVTGRHDEPVPASSRRLVAPSEEEQLSDMAFGDAAAELPRHPPPPESGPLLASSAAAEVNAHGASESAPPASAARAPVGHAALEPEAVRPELSDDGPIAEIVGDAPRFASAKFVELLDASLAL